MSMTVPYEATGRTHQKTRTRAALVTAARRLLVEGETPTVVQAADEAGVARATAYHYFPNQRALVVATYPQLDEPSLVGPRAPADAEGRLEAVARALSSQIVEHEAELRAMLRLSLEPHAAEPRELPLRKGRRITWVADALAPLEGALPKPALERLTVAVAAALGIEALVWLTDIAGLSREEAADVMRWSALAMLRSALAEIG